MQIFAQNNPTITNCDDLDGDQTFCAVDEEMVACFTIDLNGFADPIVEFQINFGDNTDTVVAFADYQQEVRHEYDLDRFFRSCTENRTFLVELLAITGSGNTLFNASRVIYENPPTARFSLPSTACVGELYSGTSSACPAINTTAMFDFGDGSPLSPDPSHTYSSTGQYTITQIATNQCGADTATQTVTVTSAADAEIMPETGVSSINGDTLIVCLGGGGIVEFNGENSSNETSYFWSVSSGATITTNRRQDSVLIRFNSAGIYTVTLEVDNDCRISNQTSVIVEVVDASPLVLIPTPDDCVPVDYTPSPFNSDATYTINNTVVTNFPIQLDIGTHTIVATLTDLCGAQQLDDEFTIAPPEQVSIVSPSNGQIFCAGDSPVSLNANIAGGTWSGSTLISTDAQGNTSFAPSTPGTYRLIYSRGTGACERSASIDVTVDGVNITLSPVLACQGDDSASLVASSPGGTWSSTDCPTCIQGDEFFFANSIGPGPFAVTYSLSNSNGCSGMGSTTVSIATPDASFDLENTFCLGQQVSATNFRGALNGQMNEWQLDGVTVSHPINGLAEGTYELALISRIGVCEALAVQNFAVIAPPPSLDLSADHLSGCGPLDVNLLLNGSGAVQTATYLWDFGRTTIDTATLITSGTMRTFTNLTDSILDYVVVVEATNICGLESDSLSIQVLPQPFARIGVDSSRTGCSPHQFTIINSSPSSTNCVWSGSDGLTFNDCRDTFTISLMSDTAVLEYIIRLEATNLCGTDINQDTLTILPPGISPFFSSDLPNFEVCPGEEIIFSDESTPIPTQIIWNLGDGTTASGETVSHRYLGEDTTYNVNLRVSTGCGYRELERLVKVLARPEGELVVEQVTCAESEIGVSIVSNAALVITQFGNGSSSNSAFANTSYDSAGNYTITTVLESQEGCLDSLNQDILVNPLPTAIAARGDTACVGQQLMFSSVSIGAVSASWAFPNGEVANGEDVQFTPTTEGLGIASLVVSSDLGCIDSTTINYFARPTPEAEFSLSTDSLCTPAEFTVLNDVTDPNVSSYLYDFGDGSNNSSLVEPIHRYNQAGEYSISQVVGIDGFCFDTAYINATSVAIPILDLAIDDTRCELGQPAIVDVTTSFENTVFFSGPNYDSVGATRHLLYNSGIYDVQVVNTFGCDSMITFELVERKPIILELIPDTTIRYGDSIELTSQVNFSNLTFNWDPSVFIRDENEQSPTVHPSENGIYVLTVTDSVGCTVTKQVRITLTGVPSTNLDTLADISTGFSPNGDGVNDVFTIYPRPYTSEISKVTIFNRWGEIVYTQVDFPNWGSSGERIEVWDGTQNGRYVNPAVFVLLLEGRRFTGEKEIQVGDITVIR